MNPFVSVSAPAVHRCSWSSPAWPRAAYSHEEEGIDVVPGPRRRTKIHIVLDYIGMGEEEGASEKEEHHEEHHKIVVTSPKAKDVTITQQYVCQIHSQRHIEVRALEDGYLEEIPVKEGQAVKKGDVMFKILPDPLPGQAGRRDGRGQARADWSCNNTKKLFEDKVVSAE